LAEPTTRSSTVLPGCKRTTGTTVYYNQSVFLAVNVHNSEFQPVGGLTAPKSSNPLKIGKLDSDLKFAIQLEPVSCHRTNEAAKIEAECLTTAQSTAKRQVGSGSKSLSVDVRR
jgi:hypothetical protein